MRNVTTPFLLCLTLVACQTGPIPVLYKEGSTRSERQEVYDQCLIKGLKEVPQNMVTEISGGYSVPGVVQCNTDGDRTFCGEVGGYTEPVSSNSYDTNARLRDRVVSRCLAAKGYQQVLLPVCKTPEERRLYAMNAKQPDITQIACVDGQSFSPN